MKKRLYCVLCVCLCLLLCSCQSEHASLLAMVEERQYSEAIDYINQLAREEAYADRENADPHPLTPYLYGTWESAADEEYAPFTFTKDGVCTVGDESFIWRESVSTDFVENRVQFDILNGTKLEYTFQLIRWEDGVYSGSANRMKNDSRYIYHVQPLRNKSHYEVITVTKENWTTYFDIVQNDSFDEYISLHAESCVSVRRDTKIVLKDEYYRRLDTVPSKATVEYKYTAGDQPIKLIWETKTCILNGDFKPYSHADEFANSCALQTLLGNQYGAVIKISSASIKKEAQDNTTQFTWYPHNVEITDFKGTLFLSKETN